MRYFFHTADGLRERDETGTELPDLNAARITAVAFAGECMRFDPDILANGRDFRVEVTDSDDKLLLTVVTLVVEVPS